MLVRLERAFLVAGVVGDVDELTGQLDHRQDVVRKLQQTKTVGDGWLRSADALRHLDPASRRFTWWDYRSGGWERNIGLRIDHFLLTPPLVDRLVDIIIDEEVRGREKASDHVPVIIELKDAPLEAEKRRPSGVEAPRSDSRV